MDYRVFQTISKTKPSRCGPVIRAWDQEVCSLCGLRFAPSMVSGSSLVVAHMMATGGLHNR
jgi:hypothetical protein